MTHTVQSGPVASVLPAVWGPLLLFWCLARVHVAVNAKATLPAQGWIHTWECPHLLSRLALTSVCLLVQIPTHRNLTLSCYLRVFFVNISLKSVKSTVCVECKKLCTNAKTNIDSSLSTRTYSIYCLYASNHIFPLRTQSKLHNQMSTHQVPQLPLPLQHRSISRNVLVINDEVVYTEWFFLTPSMIPPVTTHFERSSIEHLQGN